MHISVTYSYCVPQCLSVAINSFRFTHRTTTVITFPLLHLLLDPLRLLQVQFYSPRHEASSCYLLYSENQCYVEAIKNGKRQQTSFNHLNMNTSAFFKIKFKLNLIFKRPCFSLLSFCFDLRFVTLAHWLYFANQKKVRKLSSSHSYDPKFWYYSNFCQRIPPSVALLLRNVTIAPSVIQL